MKQPQEELQEEPQEEPRLVSVEGNIGAGKSTLLRAIDALGLPGVVVMQEPVDAWRAPVLPGGRSMLQAYYEDPRGNSLAFQMYAMLSRVQQLEEVSRRALEPGSGVRLVVTERCSGSDFELFGKPMHDAGLFNDAEWHAYESWYRATAARHRDAGASVLSPSGVAYLRVAPDVCAARITTRGREEEATGVDREYLARLHAAHETYAAGCALPVLELRGEDTEADARALLDYFFSGGGKPPPEKK